jgi:hypothetical protein
MKGKIAMNAMALLCSIIGIGIFVAIFMLGKKVDKKIIRSIV